MNIAVDGGGLCRSSENRFGNHTFSTSFFLALSQYEKKHSYVVYTFCKEIPFRSAQNIQFLPLWPTPFWMSVRVSLEETKRKTDIFLAVNQALPLYTQAKTISFSHGLSFHLFPHLYWSDYGRMEKQLQSIIKRSSCIIVSSLRVQKEFIRLYGKHLPRVEVIPFGVPYDFQQRLNLPRGKYFLYVGSDHSIKNIPFLLKIFKKFRAQKIYRDYRLIIAGCNIKGENIVSVPHPPREDLRELYARATAYVTASRYESFNFPVLEALSQNTPVIGLKTAIIPEMENYVNIAKNETEFLKAMGQTAKGKTKRIDYGTLLHDFSWKTYVERLRMVYSS